MYSYLNTDAHSLNIKKNIITRIHVSIINHNITDIKFLILFYYKHIKYYLRIDNNVL